MLYEGPEGVVVCHSWNGKHIIHSELYAEDPKGTDLKNAFKISAAIDNAFRRKGISTLYTWAETEQQDKYNAFLGYEPTGYIVNDEFMDKDYPREVREYKKELN